MLAISRSEAGWLRLAAIAEGLFEREGRAWMNLPRRRFVGPIRISAKRAEFALIHRPTADTRSRNVKLSEMKEVANGGVLNHPGICGYVVPDPLFRAERSTICNNYAASQQRPLYPAKSWDEPSKPLRGSASRFWHSPLHGLAERHLSQPRELWSTTISSALANAQDNLQFLKAGNQIRPLRLSNRPLGSETGHDPSKGT